LAIFGDILQYLAILGNTWQYLVILVDTFHKVPEIKLANEWTERMLRLSVTEKKVLRHSSTNKKLICVNEGKWQKKL
jgi:hypothetical protein